MTNLNIHVGAYAVIKAAPILVPVRVATCPDHGKVNNDWVYCPLCGKVLNSQIVKEERQARLFQVFPDWPTDAAPDAMFPRFYELLRQVDFSHPEDLIYAIGNLSDDSTKVEFDSNDGGEAQIEVNDPARMMVNFIKRYSDVLDAIKEKAISVEVRFGVLTWYY